MPQLAVIVASTRQGRAGRAIADWFAGVARAHGAFDVALVDLKDLALPLFDEPNHPRLKQYVGEETKAWSAIVDAADAFVFVTPEYNYGTPPALVNALDYLYAEWNYKAAGFVSYGGVSAGLRSVQMTKQIVGALKMVPIPESVAIPSFTQLMDKETGAFQAADSQRRSATAMLNELAKWTAALVSLRA